MAYLGESDISEMLADLGEAGGGVDVVVGDVTAVGLLDEEGAEFLATQMPGIVASDLVLHVQRSALPGLISGVSATVDGEAYVAMQVLPYGDGALARVVLRRAA